MPSSKPTTPARRDKRVRFSDLGPDDSAPAASTGLTPAIRRHTLSPAAARTRPSKSPGRRRSLPASLDHASGTIQFAPLRQILDGRVKRRIRRNHLSEELNEIDAEKRLGARLKRQELVRLRDEIADKDQEVERLRAQLDGHDSDKTRQLEAEVERLRQELAAGHVQVAADANESVSMMDLDADDGFDANMTDIRESSPYHDSVTTADSAPLLVLASPRSPAMSVQTEDDEKVRLEEQINFLKASLQQLAANHELVITSQQRLMSKLASFIPPSTAASDEDPFTLDAALDAALTALVLAQSNFQEARASVSALSTEVAELGFQGQNAEEMLDTIQQQFRRTRLELEYLHPGETVEGLDNSRLLALLIDRVKRLMEEVELARREKAQRTEEHEAAQDQVRTAKANQYSAERRAIVAEQHWSAIKAKEKAAESKMVELASEAEERDRSIERLQAALEGYRKEVKSLEQLVVKLEDEQNAKAGQLRREMDEAVADLEGRLEAETETVRDVSADLEQKSDLIRSLNERLSQAMAQAEEARAEHRSLLAQKEDMLADLRDELSDQVEGRDADVEARDRQIDDLQTQVLDLSESLASANASINGLSSTQSKLQARLQAETDAGAQVVEAMQAEMMRSLARVAEVKNGFLNGRSVTGTAPAMPATPQSIRFAATPKKKRRFDSGIGVLEEDDEDGVDL